MRRAPRFRSPLRHCVALRQIRQLLIRISDINVLPCFFVDQRTKILLVLPFDDKNHFLEPRHDRVVKRKIQNDLSLVADRFDLLQPAETAAHARRHDHQDRFFFHILPLSSCCTILHTAAVAAAFLPYLHVPIM